MRIALTTAMLLAATLVCAEEPSSADAKPTPAAEATQASPSEQAAEPAATEQATAADEESTATEKAADAAEQPAADDGQDGSIAVFKANSVEHFGKSTLPVQRVYGDYTAVVEEVMSKEKVPPGYRSKRINGKQVYCTASGAVTGARLSAKEQCRTEEQLRAIAKKKAEMEQR